MGAFQYYFILTDRPFSIAIPYVAIAKDVRVRVLRFGHAGLRLESLFAVHWLRRRPLYLGVGPVVRDDAELRAALRGGPAGAVARHGDGAHREVVCADRRGGVRHELRFAAVAVDGEAGGGELTGGRPVRVGGRENALGRARGEGRGCDQADRGEHGGRRQAALWGPLLSLARHATVSCQG